MWGHCARTMSRRTKGRRPSSGLSAQSPKDSETCGSSRRVAGVPVAAEPVVVPVEPATATVQVPDALATRAPVAVDGIHEEHVLPVLGNQLGMSQAPVEHVRVEGGSAPADFLQELVALDDLVTLLAVREPGLDLLGIPLEVGGTRDVLDDLPVLRIPFLGKHRGSREVDEKLRELHFAVPSDDREDELGRVAFGEARDVSIRPAEAIDRGLERECLAHVDTRALEKGVETLLPTESVHARFNLSEAQVAVLHGLPPSAIGRKFPSV